MCYLCYCSSFEQWRQCRSHQDLCWLVETVSHDIKRRGRSVASWLGTRYLILKCPFPVLPFPFSLAATRPGGSVLKVTRMQLSYFASSQLRAAASLIDIRLHQPMLTRRLHGLPACDICICIDVGDFPSDAAAVLLVLDSVTAQRYRYT